MSDILEIYVKKIRNNLDNLGNKFAQLELCSHNEIKRIIKEIEEIINNIDNLMKNFSIELIMNQTSSNEINNFRESLSKYKLKLKKIKEEDKKEINNNKYLDENIQFIKLIIIFINNNINNFFIFIFFIVIFIFYH